MWFGMNWVNEFIMVIIGLLKLFFFIFVVCYNVCVFVILWFCVLVVECSLGIIFLNFYLLCLLK